MGINAGEYNKICFYKVAVSCKKKLYNNVYKTKFSYFSFLMGVYIQFK